MRTTQWFALTLLHFAFFLLPSLAATNDLTILLQQGLFEEEANRNLDAAIAEYQSLASQFDRDRQVAATAVFRLGECYRKLGKTNAAVAEYQKVIQDFGDQSTLVTLSRQNLAGLNSAPKASATNPVSDEAAAQAAVAESEARSLGAELDRMTSMDRERLRVYVQQNYGNPVLTKLLQDRADAQQKLVIMAKDYTPEHPAYRSTKELIATIEKQIDDQVDGVLAGLRAKQRAAEQSAKALHAAAASPSPPRTLLSLQEGDETAAGDDAEAQEIRRLQVMLQNSPDLFNAVQEGSTPLEKAARNGQFKVVAFLLDHGADATRGTPLVAAASVGNRAMVEYLLNRGVSVNAKGGVYNGTALHAAIERGYEAVAKVLIDHKVGLEERDQNGRTPLIVAADRNRAPLVQMLLAAGADPNIKDYSGRTALSSAAGGSPEIERMLLAAKADPNGATLNAPLLCAIHAGNVDSAGLLLEHGADPNAKGAVTWQIDYGGKAYYSGASVTPLGLAVLTGQVPMVELLLKHKADPNGPQVDGQPIVTSALSETNILERLLAAGAKTESRLALPNMNDVHQGTLLQVAALQGNAPAVDILLKHGADANARGDRGNRVLHYAAMLKPDSRTFQLLIDHGAELNVRNDDDLTPLDLLKRMAGWPEAKNFVPQVANLLRRHGALDNLPDWSRIEVRRPWVDFSAVIFQKATNDWNQFTLLQALLNFYDSGRTFGVPEASGGVFIANSGGQALPFPDLSRVTIVRPVPGTTNSTRVTLNLLDATNGIDCSKDVPLEFGDTVEIPERDHPLAAREGGLTDAQAETLRNHFQLTVQLKVRDKNVELHPNIYYPRIGLALNSQEARSLLLASSDLSRVKVIRRDPRTSKTKEWLLDCRTQPQSNPPFIPKRFRGRESFDSAPPDGTPDFWLRDGDVIEVPEKGQ